MTPRPESAPADRDRFRSFPLDGGALFFHPRTGTNLRVVNPATVGLRRTAPRVAMFGITNVCNLRCAFCSRDVARESTWTPASAAALLTGLARRGTLEVAFGGGEPFAFPGFADLIAQLHESTALALHVTTNGTLLRESSWRAFQANYLLDGHHKVRAASLERRPITLLSFVTVEHSWKQVQRLGEVYR